jgi:hypothetical protein
MLKIWPGSFTNIWKKPKIREAIFSNNISCKDDDHQGSKKGRIKSELSESYKFR